MPKAQQLPLMLALLQPQKLHDQRSHHSCFWVVSWLLRRVLVLDLGSIDRLRRGGSPTQIEQLAHKTMMGAYLGTLCLHRLPSPPLVESVELSLQQMINLPSCCECQSKRFDRITLRHLINLHFHQHRH